MSTFNGIKQEKHQGDAGPGEPVVIPESDHPIRVHHLDKEALKVLYRLRDAGFAGYLVGGGVRDLYLGKQPKDFDISTDAHPGQLRKLFRNSRTIGRRFRLVQVFFRGGKIIEVSTLRSRSEYDIGGAEKVLPSNNSFGTLPEDALRRDLTVNSLFYEIENKTIIDYVGGVQDLDKGVIRIVGDPNRRVTHDPVRILRAVRHAARSGFSIEPTTWKAIIANRDKLNLCPSSRVRDELLKDLQGGASALWSRIALECSLFFTLFPCYEDLLSGDRKTPHREMLLSLLGAVDRLHTFSNHDFQVEIPDYVLLAVLILPWVDARFGLLEHRLKGPALYRYSREIRAGLDEVFGEHFNLKRMSKESMTTLLVNLPSFVHYDSTKNWPAWLRKKSYFNDCFRFYRLYVEAQGGALVDEKLFGVQNTTREVNTRFAPAHSARSSSSKAKGRKGTKPAFTDRRKGIFGFRGV